MKWFKPNIDSTGRIVRAIFALLMMAAGMALSFQSLWAGMLLLGMGGLAIFEALRGWCLVRACGIKTKW